MTIMITIPGNPIAKKRPRFARHGKDTRTYNEQETEESRFLFHFLQQWERQPIKGEAVSLGLTFYMKRPKSHFGTGRNAGKVKRSAMVRHTAKPDIDNLVKFTMDVLNGHAFHDDNLVDSLHVTKEYSEQPRTVILIRTKKHLVI